MNVVPLQTGAMVNFVGIFLALFGWSRSTEFSILLLRQFRRLRNAHSVLCGELHNFDAVYVQVWRDPLPLPAATLIPILSPGPILFRQYYSCGTAIFFITITRFWLVKFSGFARSLVRTEKIIRVPCIGPFGPEPRCRRNNRTMGLLAPTRERSSSAEY